MTSTHSEYVTKKNELKLVHAARILDCIKFLLRSDETVELSDNGTAYSFNGVPGSFSFEFHEQYSSGSYLSWNSKPNGKYRIVISENSGKGGRSRQVNLPQRLDGQFDYGRIASAILVEARARDVHQKQYSTRKSNEAGVKAFREEKGIPQYSGEFSIAASTEDKAPTYVSVHFGRHLSYSDAEKLLNVLRGIEGLDIAPFKAQ